MFTHQRLKNTAILTAAWLGLADMAYAEVIPQSYCRVKMCEVRAHCISNDCDAVECREGSFTMELSSIGNQLNTFAVGPDKDSKIPIAGFEFDTELSIDGDLVASRTNNKEIAYIQVELHKGQPTDVTITTQTRGSLVEVSVLHGHCGEDY